MKTAKQPAWAAETHDLDDLLKTGLIALDTNVLLNLFRYSESTSSDWIRTLENTEDRLVLPQQVGEEFYENLPTVQTDLEKEYKKVEESLNGLAQGLTKVLVAARDRHPAFNDRQVESKASELVEQLKELFAQTKSDYQETLGTDGRHTDLKERVEALFDQRALRGFTQAELMRIYQDGLVRYELLIPPWLRRREGEAGLPQIRRARSLGRADQACARD